MNYVYVPPTKEKHLVTFWEHEHPNIFEAGPGWDQYFLTQDVKSWLVKNDIKVFVTYDCGDMGGGIPEFTLEFLSQEDAQQFIEAWG